LLTKIHGVVDHHKQFFWVWRWFASATAVGHMFTQVIDRYDMNATAVAVATLPAVLVAGHSGTSTMSIC